MTSPRGHEPRDGEGHKEKGLCTQVAFASTLLALRFL